MLEDLLLIQYTFIQNQLIESMIKNFRELLENQITFTNIFFIEQTFVFLFKITELRFSFSSNQFSSSSLWYLRTYLIKIKLLLISCNKHVHKLSLLSSTHNTLLHSLLLMNQTLKSSYLMIWKYERNVFMLLIEKQIISSRWNNKTRTKFISWKQNYKLLLLSQSM